MAFPASHCFDDEWWWDFQQPHIIEGGSTCCKITAGMTLQISLALGVAKACNVPAGPNIK
jgi:hypothetical protein